MVEEPADWGNGEMDAHGETGVGVGCDVRSLSPVEPGSRNEKKLCERVFVVVPTTRRAGNRRLLVDQSIPIVGWRRTPTKSEAFSKPLLWPREGG